MGQILKFPAQASKFGYRRVRKRAAEDPNQLHLFAQPTAVIIDFLPGASRFEYALMLDERDDVKAAELYSQAIEAGDCVADAYCNLGIIQSRQGNTTKAFDCFTSALKHDPRHFEAHYNLGNLYFDLEDFRLARVHFEMAAEVDPLFANVFFNLALVQALHNDHSAAITALTRYQQLASPQEAKKADELLGTLKKSLAAARNTRPGRL